MRRRILLTTAVALALAPSAPASAGTLEMRVFHVATGLDAGDGSGPPPNDYYLDGGTADGVAMGMRLPVFRVLKTANRVRGGLHETWLPVGELQVLEAFDDTAVARVSSLAEMAGAPLFEPRAVMIGDYVMHARPDAAWTPTEGDEDSDPAVQSAPNSDATPPDEGATWSGAVGDERVHGSPGGGGPNAWALPPDATPFPPGFPSSDVWYPLPPPVLFALNSADLDLAAQYGLEGVAQMLTKHPERILSLEGRTCDLGGHAYNRALSLRRARTVAAYLQSRGVEAERLAVLGHGESSPVGPNASEEQRRRNRRVDLRLGTVGPRPEAEIPGLPIFPPDVR